MVWVRVTEGRKGICSSTACFAGHSVNIGLLWLGFARLLSLVVFLLCAQHTLFVLANCGRYVMLEQCIYKHNLLIFAYQI